MSVEQEQNADDPKAADPQMASKAPFIDYTGAGVPRCASTYGGPRACLSRYSLRARVHFNQANKIMLRTLRVVPPWFVAAWTTRPIPSRFVAYNHDLFSECFVLLPLPSQNVGRLIQLVFARLVCAGRQLKNGNDFVLLYPRYSSSRWQRGEHHVLHDNPGV